MTTTLKSDIIKILEEVTPMCTDVLKLIAEYAEPVKFEVDKTYTSEKNKEYKVLHRTRCFIDILPHNRKYSVRTKIRYTDFGDECTNIYGCEILNV